MKVLIATDKFKGSLTQKQACQAIAEGVKRARPDAIIEIAPLADGGEGTVEAVVDAVGGRIAHFDVCGPIAGMRINAPIGLIDDGRTAIVELAAASGLLLLPHEQRDPTRTTTFGTGELLKHAADCKPKKIILGIGGSATCDAGLGIIQAWGGAVKMTNGKVYTPKDRKLCGNDMNRVVSISKYQPTFANYSYDRKNHRQALLDGRGIEFVVACDVGNPLYGPDGAAQVFAPQKGATPQQVKQLDDDMKKMIDRLQLHEYANRPGAGAAGGAGFAMMAMFGAEMVNGTNLFMELTGLKEKIKAADLIITGEGRLDLQTVAGKAPAGIARACKEAGKKCIAIAGSIGPGAEGLLDEGLSSYFSIMNGPMALADAMENAASLVADTAERVMRLSRKS